MSKIELPTITSGYNLSTINNNFQKIEDALNEEVLYRKGYLGEPNEMQTNLDMNGKQILNVAIGTSDGSLVTKGYVDQGLALKFDKSGGPISGPVNMQNNQINNLPNATQPSQPATYAQLLQVEAPGDSLLRNDLAAAGGAGLIGFLQSGTGAVPRSAQSKMRDFVHVADFGAVGDGVSSDTLAIQMAIDYVYTVLGGGAVLLGPKQYKISQSSLNEIYDNEGVPFNASGCCIVLRKGVSLIGVAGKTKIFADNPALNLIALVANDGNVIRGFEAYNTWVAGSPGAGHGIFQFGTQGGVDKSCKNTVFEDLYIHNVASYGIGIQNGAPENIHFNRIRVKDCGADGLDLKSRGDQSIIPAGNSATNIRVINHGVRVTGSAGIDVRGVWHLKNIVVTNYGGNAALDYTGIRFRTKPPISDPYQIVAERSTLNGFTIIPTIGAAAASISGVECGSDDTHISNGYVEDCHHGIIHTGNYNGSSIRATVTDVTSVNARQYGFRAATNTQYIKYVGCEDIGAVTAGFRIEGDNCTMVACNGVTSISSGAAPTLVQTANRTGNSYVSIERLSSTSVAVTAKGTSENIQLNLNPQGTGHIQVYGDIRPNAANTRYLGSGSLPFAGGFIQTALTVTSDERAKTRPVSFTDAMLDSAAEVDWCMFQYLDRVEEKGTDGARWHFGAIAQRFVEAFERHGLDPYRFAFICYDEWGDSPELIGEDGEVVSPAVDAGSRYGIRYDQAIILKQKQIERDHNRKIEALMARIDALESK